MSDDLSNKIKQIAELLSQDGLPDSLKGLLSAFAPNPGKEDPQPPVQNQLPAPVQERNEKSEADDTAEMLRKVKKVMDQMNSKDDPRISLLTAIHPFLNNKRQKRLSNCIKILSMSKLTGLVDEHGKSSN